jgi:2-oxoglutarate dehydrogenase E2 component (dihydrolipoamide succinyltransferase)
MAHEVRIPELGESVSDGVIVRWAKADGEQVGVDEVLLELETDKASLEIVAEQAGVLHIDRQVGETVNVGDVVGRLEAGAATAAAPSGASAPAAAAQPGSATPSPASQHRAPAPAPASRPEPPEPAPEPAPDPAPEPALGPAARRLVREHDVDPTTIEGSGPKGRVTKEDVAAHVAARAESDPPATPSEPKPSAAKPAAEPAEAPSGAGTVPARTAARVGTLMPREPSEGEERVPMGRIRKRIAERLVKAQHTAAILTTFNEIDMSAVLAVRKEYKDRFEERHGVRLGFMSFFATACVAALGEIPAINAEIRGDEIVYKHFVNLGVAVGTERGLVVPVVKNADRMTFAQIEREIGRLAERARVGKLSIDELSGGTFSISNGGVYGSLMSTPILNPPQSAILGMHKIEQRPVVVDGEIVARPMMYVAVSYDHRLVDGEQAVTFLVRVKERLEAPARLLLDV